MFDWSGGPPAPHWLPQFAPGEVVGQPIQGFPVKTPSGQLWSRTPWSHRQGLSAYIDRYAGVVPGMVAHYQDMLDRIERMRLRRHPMGAGRWAIPRQW